MLDLDVSSDLSEFALASQRYQYQWIKFYSLRLLWDLILRLFYVGPGLTSADLSPRDRGRGNGHIGRGPHFLLTHTGVMRTWGQQEDLMKMNKKNISFLSSDCLTLNVYLLMVKPYLLLRQAEGEWLWPHVVSLRGRLTSVQRVQLFMIHSAHDTRCSPCIRTCCSCWKEEPIRLSLFSSCYIISSFLF